MTTHRWSFALGLMALVAGFVAAWPALHLVLVQANLSSYYQENIGYRFFWVQRLIDGAPGDVIIPSQGVLMSLIQAVYYLIGKALGLDLYGQIDLFALLTLAVPAIAMILLAVAIARDDELDVGVRAVLVTAPLVISFGGPQLFSYSPYPDYLAYGKFALFFFSWRWLHYRGWEGFESRSVAIEFGVITGLIAAFKPNYVLLPAGLMLCSLLAMQPERRRESIRMVVTIGLSSFAAFAACFLLHYGGRVDRIYRFFDVLFGWSSSLSASSSGFSLRFIPPSGTVFTPGTPPAGDPHATEVTLSWLIVILAAACVVALLLALKARHVRPAVLTFIMALVGGLAVYMAFLRGGGSSYFDAVVVVSVLCALVFVAFENGAARQLTAFTIAAIFVVWPGAWIAANWRIFETVAVTGHDSLLKLGKVGDWQRKLFDWNRSQGLPIYVLTPTNYYGQGTIEDMMNIGFSDFNTNTSVSNSNPSRIALYPQYTFLYFSDVAPTHPPGYKMALPPQRVVLMQIVGEPGPDYPRLDPKILARHNQELQQLLQGRQREQCYTVRHVLSQVDIMSCVYSAP